MVHWLRICLAMQGTPVRSLVQEDPTCDGATEPVHQQSGAREPQLLSLSADITESKCLGTMLSNKRSHCNKKLVHTTREECPLATT